MIEHPKKSLLERGGTLISLSTMTEEEYAQVYPTQKVWDGKEWAETERDGRKMVASVRCLGEHLISVSDQTASSASNRASCFVLSILDNNSDLSSRFTAMRSALMRNATLDEDS